MILNVTDKQTRNLNSYQMSFYLRPSIISDNNDEIIQILESVNNQIENLLKLNDTKLVTALGGSILSYETNSIFVNVPTNNLTSNSIILSYCIYNIIILLLISIFHQ